MATSSQSSISLPIQVFQTQTSRTRGAYSSVWDAEHAMHIRNKLRILGDLCGTLPKHIAQNQYLSLPLLLSYEETMLGVNRGYFTLVSDNGSDYTQLGDAHVRFWDRRAREAERQAVEAAKERARERARRTGRKRAREERDDDEEGVVRKAARFVWQWVSKRVGWARAEEEDQREAQEQTPAAVDISEAASARGQTLVETSTKARAEEGARRASRRLESCSKRVLERISVLEDLHERGYYVSCGAKFGADFLAYASSPLVVHAALAVVVVRAAEKLHARRLVAVGRLGDATRKRALLATVSGGKVSYVGVQWEETLP
ncbi:tRNA-splicing endonuclease subunit Sen34 [Gracilariopsis chorda]|uniref:tRNA-splicing endonuclease subunit Sen34 n=1 Tax=Gracilariopsis chorda TaxID=448386 RepID=A0A2V3IMP8_9FLOR|nr:tRNA-splicing endonuclease subunit Sen34 [Gracilariopsis chorda]|eukprot:PXF43356.1 tRNA-splicing endonuclease subunit Sen34 [Gracilariopsis chorda]